MVRLPRPPGTCSPAQPSHSPSEEGLLQALAGGKGFPGEHVAHDNVQAAGHEGQHSLGLEGATAGDQAQALQHGALAQRLEELGVGAEVGLLQPVGREGGVSPVGTPALCCWWTRQMRCERGLLV